MILIMGLAAWLACCRKPATTTATKDVATQTEATIDRVNSEDILGQLSVAELQAMARRRQVATTGRKRELVARLAAEL